MLNPSSDFDEILYVKSLQELSDKIADGLSQPMVLEDLN
jgi:hypothetical protein